VTGKVRGTRFEVQAEVRGADSVLELFFVLHTSNLALQDDDGEGYIAAVGEGERDVGDAERSGAVGGAAG
jgi:hypothetical protein